MLETIKVLTLCKEVIKLESENICNNMNKIKDEYQSTLEWLQKELLKDHISKEDMINYLDEILMDIQQSNYKVQSPLITLSNGSKDSCIYEIDPNIKTIEKEIKKLESSYNWDEYKSL